MNKADLLDALEARLGSRKAAADAVETVVDLIVREVAAGGRVAITGFGTFEPSVRAARTGRNPRTGESVHIAGTTIPRFRPGTQFKALVADPDALPADGLVGSRSSSTTSASATTPRATSRRSRSTAGATDAPPAAEAARDDAPRRGKRVKASDLATEQIVEKAKKKAAKKKAPKKADTKGDTKSDAKADAKGSKKAKK